MSLTEKSKRSARILARMLAHTRLSARKCEVEEIMSNPKDNLCKKIKALGEIRHNPNLLLTIGKMVVVHNERGSFGRSEKCSNCDTWKNHWIRLTGAKWPKICSNVNCSNKATDGGHIAFADDKTGRRYIVPLCSRCNGLSPDNFYTIEAGTVVISANCSDTCDKLV